MLLDSYTMNMEISYVYELILYVFLGDSASLIDSYTMHKDTSDAFHLPLKLF